MKGSKINQVLQLRLAAYTGTVLILRKVRLRTGQRNNLEAGHFDLVGPIYHR